MGAILCHTEGRLECQALPRGGIRHHIIPDIFQELLLLLARLELRYKIVQLAAEQKVPLALIHRAHGEYSNVRQLVEVFNDVREVCVLSAP